MSHKLPHGLISYGPNANCTLALCPVEASVYQYAPSLPANATLLSLFGLNLIFHAVQGWIYRPKQWAFALSMVVGCIDEMIGYGGRIMLHYNPFSFAGFLIQIICIATGPLFYCAAIYVTLSQIVRHLGVQYSRFRPNLFYWIFIPCDVISLSLQAAGGALSSVSSGSSQMGVDVALAGLSLQVFTLLIFIALCLDYWLRWRRGSRNTTDHNKGRVSVGLRFRLFVVFLALAIVLILARCAYRVDELSEGYNGPLIKEQGLFIGLEGVLIIISAFSLNIGHPGFGLESPERSDRNMMREEQGVHSKHETADDIR